MSQDTGKPLHAKRLVFRIYFSSSIMELQKCSLACPYREVLEKSQVIDRGLCYSKLWILSYLSLDVWWNENHLHQWERGLGSVVVCSSDGLVFQDSRLELNWNTARRPSALVRMVKIHSWTTVWIQTLLCISNRLFRWSVLQLRRPNLDLLCVLTYWSMKQSSREHYHSEKALMKSTSLSERV